MKTSASTIVFGSLTFFFFGFVVYDEWQASLNSGLTNAGYGLAGITHLILGSLFAIIWLIILKRRIR